jgi:lactose/L-arabinose transport system substrate-binding protein
MLKSCGGGYFDEAGNLNIANNEKIQKISQIYLEMLDKGVFQEEIGWDTYIGNINNGNVAGAMNGCWIMSSIQMAEDQSGLWEITNIPSVDGVEGATNYSSQGGSTWTITSACKNVDLAVDFFNSTFAGSTELYDEILPTVAIATWIPAGNSDTYKQPVAYFSDQPIYSMIVDYTAKVPSSVISAYDSSSRNAVCTAITNAAYSGKDIIEELKKAEETVSFEMEQ